MRLVLLTSVLVLVLLLLTIGVTHGEPVNMYENEAEIEVLDSTSFDRTVYGSAKSSFVSFTCEYIGYDFYCLLRERKLKSETLWTHQQVEFYAHWCGACKRYKPLIIELAKYTHPWHSRVMRVSVINCGDPSNDNICRAHNIDHYPTLKMFPAQAVFNEDDANHGATVLSLDSAKILIHKMIDFIEHHPVKPAEWPDLETFT
jgi:hypothetical protein